MKVLVAEPKDFSKEVIALLNKKFDLTITRLTPQELESVFCRYDIFWFRLGFEIDKSLIEQPSRRVKYIVTPVTGLNHIDTEACEKHGVKVISLKGEIEFLKEVRATAEHTLLLSLALLRKLIPAASSTMNGEWDREPFKGCEIYNKTVGIIGYGRLGKIVSSYFRAMGAKILIYDRYSSEEMERSSEFVNLEFLLKKSDIVSLHINYSPENKNFFCSKYFSMMKSSAVFINTSRGQMVDSFALKNALISGEISGAALDVISDEYNLKNSTEFEMLKDSENINLIITPHIGGNTWESFDKTEKFVYNKLLRAIS